jgi:tetratricopeptide (TPR) repeat protein
MNRKEALIVLGILGAAALSYAPLWEAFPLDLDLVLRSPVVTDPGRLLADFFRPNPLSHPGPYTPTYAYRPVTELSFVWNLALTGPSAAGLRLGSLLLHVACAVLAFLIARQAMGPGRESMAAWAGLFFAVHPLQAQTLTYLYQRYVIVEALLAGLALLLYWRARGIPAPWRSGAAWGALACGALAMGAKETAVTLPLTLAALEWILREPGVPWRGVFKRWLPFALLPLIVGVQVWRAQQAHLEAVGTGLFSEAAGYSPLSYALLQIPLLLRYLTLAALPFPLRFHFDREAASPDAVILLGGAILLALAGWVLFGPARHRLPRLALALFFTPLALECSVFPIKHLAWQHRCYPGLLGAGLLFAWMMDRLPRRAGFLAAVTLALLAAGTFSENRLWASPVRIARRDVRHAFHIPYVWTNLASQRLRAGRPQPARRLVAQALRMPWILELPSLDRAQLIWAARHLSDRGQAARAESLLMSHRGRFPDFALLWDHLGWIRILQDNLDGAREAYREAVRLAPDSPKAHYHLGTIALHQGDLDAAEAHLREALRWKPDYPKASQQLAETLARRGRKPEGKDP